MIRRILRGFWLLVLLSVLVGGGLLAWSFFSVHKHLSYSFGAKVDCAVVYGAAVWKDDIPSHALSDRMQAAIGLYKNGNVDCLVLSGGASKYGAHEVDVMAKMAQEYNIPLLKIERDLDGTSTIKTVQNLKKGRSYVMVSQGPHLARIALLADKFDLADYALHAAQPIRWQRQTYDDFFWNEVAKNIYYLFSPVPKGDAAAPSPA